MISRMKLPKAYDPNQYEADIYALWEKGGAFRPRETGQNYSIVMPPPNANANLHIGYELTAVLEDIAARYHRSKGDSVMLLPGADHAGFETQSVYEKHLAKEGKSRFDFSREELYRQIWDFVALNRDSFETQLRKMGVSCDWEHYTFTLDEKIINRAYATFKKMWDEGLIYRGEVDGNTKSKTILLPGMRAIVRRSVEISDAMLNSDDDYVREGKEVLAGILKDKEAVRELIQKWHNESPATNKLSRTVREELITDFMKDHPGATSKDVADALKPSGLTESSAKTTLKDMREAGSLVSTLVDSRNRWTLAETTGNNAT